MNPDATCRIEPLGDRAILVVLGEGIDGPLNERVHGLAAAIREEHLPGVLDIVPAYATLALHYDPLHWRFEDLAARLAPLAAAGGRLGNLPPRRVELPVLYGGEVGMDQEEVARVCGLEALEVVRRHSAGEYRVFLLGFAPWFAYLGGLDPSIAAPRRATPRPRVPAGSVGIAGNQTGIYPLATPGGWQIIGRTPLRLFDPAASDPCLLHPGDVLRFVPVDEARFLELEGGAPWR